MTDDVDLADHRPDVYLETIDGRETWVFRASSFGNCDAQLVRQAVGQTPEDAPDMIMDAYKAGVRFEAKILDRLRGHGWKLVDPMACGDYGTVDATGQLNLELRVAPNAIIRCHPDGIAQCWKTWAVDDPILTHSSSTGDRRVVEAKALARSWVDPLRTKPQYAWQVSIEMAATKLPGAFLIGWKDDCECVDEVESPATGKKIKVSRHKLCARCGGGLKYVDEKNVDVEWVDDPPYGLGEIKARARKLLKMIEEGERGVVPACTWAMFPCGFYPMHDTTQGVWLKQDAEITERGRDELEPLIAEWHKAKVFADRWNGKVDEVRARIVEVTSREMPGAGTVKVGGVKVEWHPAGTSKRLDPAMMRAAGLDPEQYKKESTVKAHVKLTEEKT